MPSCIFKAARDVDLYVSWPSVSDRFFAAGTREEYLAARCDPDRLDRADETGTSVGWQAPGYPVVSAWDDVDGVQCRNHEETGVGDVPRDRFVDVARRLVVAGDRAGLSGLIGRYVPEVSPGRDG